MYIYIHILCVYIYTHIYARGGGEFVSESLRRVGE